jgi:hypothetical protein
MAIEEHGAGNVFLTDYLFSFKNVLPHSALPGQVPSFFIFYRAGFF